MPPPGRHPPPVQHKTAPPAGTAPLVTHKTGYRSVKDIDEIVKEAEKSKACPTENTSCAALVQYYTRLGTHDNWREGVRVRGNHLKKGTAIATFVGGVYQNNPHDNHAAFYKDQNDHYLIVVDQWDGQLPHERPIPWDGMYPDRHKHGKMVYMGRSNEGNAFSVIELKDK